MQFDGGHAILSCGTKSVLTQLLELNGTHARIRIEIPFTPRVDLKSRIYIDENDDLYRNNTEILEFDPFDQYTLQSDTFAESVLFGKPPFMSLEDSIANMRIIDGILNNHPYVQ